MTDREERQHVIEVLKSWDGYFIGYTSDEVQEALRYAIASIETDLRYDLLYEETSGQADKPTPKMTNGQIYIGSMSHETAIGILKLMLEAMEVYDSISPTLERVNAVKMGIEALEQESNCLKIPTGSTTNDNLGVDYLGVDAISRQAINGYIDYILSHGMGKKKSFDFIKKFVANLPPVTPIRPKGHWISHGKHCENLGVIPSGLGAYEWCSNCDCGIDVREWHRNNYNYCPNCGARMIEPQESED